MKAKPFRNDKGELFGYHIQCLGCEDTHLIYTDAEVSGFKCVWGFNGNIDAPTFTPSLLCTTGSFAQSGYIDDPAIPPTRCHSFVTNGKIQYLNDCTHYLKGQTIDLPEFKEE